MAGSGGYAGQLGWSVGLESWLDAPDSPVRRYWRVIEFGSAATEWPWQGEVVAGLWGSQARGRIGSGHGRFSSNRDEKLVPYFKKLGQDMLGPARHALWDFMEGGKGPNMELLKVDRFMKVLGGKKRVDGSHAPRRYAMRPVTTPAQARRARASLFHWLLTATAADISSIPFVVGQITNPVEAGHYYRRALSAFPLEAEQGRAVEEAFAFALRSGSKSPLQQLRKVQAFDNSTGSASRGRARTYVDSAGLRRYGAHSGAMIAVAASPTVQTLTRDDKGRFVNGTWQQALREANELVAKAFQQAVVDEMEQQGERPRTGAMAKATRDPRNRYPRDLG